MFGLMKPSCRKCDKSAERHRQFYCGVCKTLGVVYGHRSRFFLNHDVVFLAELLHALYGTRVIDWHPAYLSRSCFTLPDDGIPHVLRYAAFLNVILALSKINDRVRDGNGKSWRLVSRLFDNCRRKANEEAALMGFSLSLFNHFEAGQVERERIPASSDGAMTPVESLEYLAAPTAHMTAYSMEHGDDSANTGMGSILGDTGFHFGTIIYLIDAIDDYGEDYKSRSFNAIRSAYMLTDDKLPVHVKSAVAGMIWRHVREMQESLSSLPIDHDDIRGFAECLERNVSCRLGEAPTLMARPSYREKFTLARERAIGICSNGCNPGNMAVRVRIAFITVILSIIPYALWAAEKETSDGGCFNDILAFICGVVLCWICCEKGGWKGCCAGTAASCFLCGRD